MSIAEGYVSIEFYHYRDMLSVNVHKQRKLANHQLCYVNKIKIRMSKND